MTHLEIVRDLTQAQTVTVTIRDLDFTQPPAAEFEITIEPEEAEEMATFSTSIAASSDDARETGGGTVTLNATTINSSGTGVWLGFRYTNVTIPSGSTINTAKQTVYVHSSDDPNLDIYGNDVDDAATYTTTSNDITGRTLTTAKVTWSATDIGTGSKDTPDLATVIQEIIDRAGWSSGNDIALLWDSLGGSSIAIRAYDYGSDYPSLTIDYTAPSSGSNPKTARIRLTTKVGGTLA